MAFCTNCGSQIQDGAKFCPKCGAPASGGAPAGGGKKSGGSGGKTAVLVLAAVAALAVLAAAVFFIVRMAKGGSDTAEPPAAGVADGAGFVLPGTGSGDVQTAVGGGDVQTVTGGDAQAVTGGDTQTVTGGGDTSVAVPAAASPRLPSPDVWLGGGIGRAQDRDNRLYKTVSFSFQETGERAAQDAIDGYLALLQDPRFGLAYIDGVQSRNDGMMTDYQTYYFRYTGSGTVGDLSTMESWDMSTSSSTPQGTAVRVRVSEIMGMTYNLYIDYVSEFEIVDEGDCFSDASYLKQYVSTGPSF